MMQRFAPGLIALLFGLLASSAGAHAIGPPSAVALAHEEIVARIQAKVAAGDDTEAALTPELTELGALFEQHRAEKTHDVADILVTRLALDIELFDQPERPQAYIRQLQEEFPDADTGLAVASALMRREARLQARAAQSSLVGRPLPALPLQWSQPAGLASLEALRGQVVVIDFWATWSVSSVRAFPRVRELAAHYAGQPVAFVAITTLQGSLSGIGPEPIDTRGDPARELTLLGEFAQARGIAGTVAVARDESFMAALAIQRLPFRVILGPDGSVRHTDLRPGDDPAEQIPLIDALLADAKKP
jgi:thiol-disulfide isomerase/thioredoxin